MNEINTIFYFVEDLDTYKAKAASGEIAARTIVFVEKAQAIYKNGVRYGGITTNDFHELLQDLYDDSWIKDELDEIKKDISDSSDRIKNLNDLINAVNDRLNKTIADLDGDILDKIKDLFADAAWIRANWPQGVTEWQEGWNDKIKAYLSTVGYWDKDKDGNDVTKWSQLKLALESIQAQVAKLVDSGEVSEALMSTIQLYIKDTVAELKLDVIYAKTEEVNKAKLVIEWMYSGLKMEAEADKTFAELSSSGKDSLHSAISDIRTQVDKVDGLYKASLDIEAKADQAIAGLNLLTKTDGVLAGLSAKIDANSDNISAILLGMGLNEATADIRTSIEEKLSGFISTADLTSAKSEIYSTIHAKDDKNQFISLASLKTQVEENAANIKAITEVSGNTGGFVAKSNLEEAVAEIFASNTKNSALAKVVALVKDRKSELQLTADDVNINGYLTGGSATFVGDIQANQFVAGQQNLSGIAVMSGDFNEAVADTSKAYFAYDSEQGAVTMWFYKDSVWQRIDLSQVAYTYNGIPEESFSGKIFKTLSSENITELPDDIPSVTIYYNRVTGKYYTGKSTSYPYATGTYYSIEKKTFPESRKSETMFTNSLWYDTPTGRVVSSDESAGSVKRYVVDSEGNMSYTGSARIVYAALDFSGNSSAGSVTVRPVFITYSEGLVSAKYWISLDGTVGYSEDVFTYIKGDTTPCTLADSLSTTFPTLSRTIYRNTTATEYNASVTYTSY